MTDLSPLARPSGGLAMLAIDQREAMRAMFAEHQHDLVSDEQLTDFKVEVAQVLTPYASAVLLDRQFALEPVVRAGAVAPGCGLIAAADHFIPGDDEIVGAAEIDREVVPERVKELGAVALKLLVIWRPDGKPQARIDMVGEFVEMCRDAELISIIEPVSRKPLDGRPWDWDEGVIAAAEELGSLGADLYKAEVPRHGEGNESDIRAGCAQLTRAIAGPWVVLSSGVPAQRFPDAVRYACLEGASGFLAGRAVWQSVIGSDDVERDLREVGVARLRRLADIVDAHAGGRR